MISNLVFISALLLVSFSAADSSASKHSGDHSIAQELGLTPEGNAATVNGATVRSDSEVVPAAPVTAADLGPVPAPPVPAADPAPAPAPPVPAADPALVPASPVVPPVPADVPPPTAPLPPSVAPSIAPAVPVPPVAANTTDTNTTVPTNSTTADGAIPLPITFPTVSTPEPSSEPSPEPSIEPLVKGGLSNAAIAQIVVGVMVPLVGAVAFGIALFQWRRRSPGASSYYAGSSDDDNDYDGLDPDVAPHFAQPSRASREEPSAYPL